MKDLHNVSEASYVSYPVCSQNRVRMLFRFALMLSGLWLVAHARRSRGVGGLVGGNSNICFLFLLVEYRVPIARTAGLGELML